MQTKGAVACVSPFFITSLRRSPGSKAKFLIEMYLHNRLMNILI